MPWRRSRTRLQESRARENDAHRRRKPLDLTCRRGPGVHVADVANRCARRRLRAAGGGRRFSTSNTRAHRRARLRRAWWTADGLGRRTPRRRLHRRRAQADGRAPPARPHRLPSALRVHGGHEGRRDLPHDGHERLGSGSLPVRDGHRGARPLLLGQRRGRRPPRRLRGLRHRGTEQPGLRLRQLRDARRQRQGRHRAPVFPRGCGSEDEGHPGALL